MEVSFYFQTLFTLNCSIKFENSEKSSHHAQFKIGDKVIGEEKDADKKLAKRRAAEKALEYLDKNLQEIESWLVEQVNK